MDATALQGIFMSFYPQIASSGRSMVAADLLYRQLRRRRDFSKWRKWEDVPEKQRERLLLTTLQRLEELDEDEAFLVLMA